MCEQRTKHTEAPMKLREAVSWLMGSLHRNLIPCLEECWERPLTDKEQQLVSILELLHIEKVAGTTGRKDSAGRNGSVRL